MLQTDFEVDRDFREGAFIPLSRRFTTRAKAEKERDRMQALFKYKQVSLGVGVVAKE
jgi:hypothetical protein